MKMYQDSWDDDVLTICGSRGSSALFCVPVAWRRQAGLWPGLWDGMKKRLVRTHRIVLKCPETNLI